MRSLVALLLALVLLAPAARAQDGERAADHDALRALFAQAVEAINGRDFSRIAPRLHPDFTIIAVDNRKLTSLPEFEAYWNGLFDGPDAILESITVNPTVDELTTFLDADTGVAYGTSDDTYTFRSGDVRRMAVRWSAMVERAAEGWQLVSVHFSANLLDNPVLRIVENRASRLAVGAGFGGLVIGAVAAVALGRLRRRSA